MEGRTPRVFWRLMAIIRLMISLFITCSSSKWPPICNNIVAIKSLIRINLEKIICLGLTKGFIPNLARRLASGTRIIRILGLSLGTHKRRNKLWECWEKLIKRSTSINMRVWSSRGNMLASLRWKKHKSLPISMFLRVPLFLRMDPANQCQGVIHW